MEISQLKKIRVVLTEKGDSLIAEILKNNGLEESSEEYLNTASKGGEPRFTIIKHAASALAQKKVPEEKLAELLQQHLKISQDIAGKIVTEIKAELLSELEIHPEEKFNDPAFREEISRRISPSESEGQGSDLAKEILRKINAKRGIVETTPEEPQGNPSVKAPAISVEENAKQIQQIKRDLNPKTDAPIEKPTAKLVPDRPVPNRNFDRAKEKQAENKFASEKKGPDDYREAID